MKPAITLGLGLVLGLTAGTAWSQQEAADDPLFTAADRDQDGEISLQEYQNQDFQLVSDEWFQQADADGSGTLDQDEYRTAMSLAMATPDSGVG